MAQIFYRLDRGEEIQTGFLEVEDTGLFYVHNALYALFPDWHMNHYHIVGEACTCGEGQ